MNILTSSLGDIGDTPAACRLLACRYGGMTPSPCRAFSMCDSQCFGVTGVTTTRMATLFVCENNQAVTTRLSNLALFMHIFQALQTNSYIIFFIAWKHLVLDICPFTHGSVQTSMSSSEHLPFLVCVCV